jgi:transcription antitermination factor NusG
MKKMIFVLTSPLLMMGCATENSIYRTFDISKGESPMVDIRQRAVLVSPNKTVSETFDKDGKSIGRTSIDRGMFVCAEPSPDAMASLAYELAAKGGAAGKASGELGFAMHDSAAFTGIRTQSIQLLRDFGYRLCESHLSGAITSAQYDLLMRRFQKNTVALLAIEQLTGTVKSIPIVLTSSGKVEATKSLAEQRVEREKIGDQISDLEKQIEGIKKRRDEAKTADPKADTATTDGQIASLDGKATRLKSDRDVVDKAIANTKGYIVEGRTEVTIKADTQSGQRSDEHLQKIADTVREIVNNIVLSDDENQLCMSALQSPSANDQQKAFADWCIKMLNNQADAKKAYISQLQGEILDARKQASAATTATKKAEAEKALDRAKSNLEREAKGSRTFSIPFALEK